MEGLDVATAAVVARERVELSKLTYGAPVLEEGGKISLPELCPWEGYPRVLYMFTRLSNAFCAELPNVAKGFFQQQDWANRFARAHDVLEALLGDAARGGLISQPASAF
ncbi:hypothetical protein Esti_002472 [Eimeria stiedai]